MTALLRPLRRHVLALPAAERPPTRSRNSDWGRVVPAVFALSALSSAFLLFWVEPLFARMVLPLLGAYARAVVGWLGP